MEIYVLYLIKYIFIIHSFKVESPNLTITNLTCKYKKTIAVNDVAKC